MSLPVSVPRWQLASFFDLPLCIGLGLVALFVVAFIAYTVWTTIAHPPRPRKNLADDLPLEVRGNTIYGGHRARHSPSDARLVESVIGSLLSPKAGRRSGRGKFLAAASDLFFGGGSSGSW